MHERKKEVEDEDYDQGFKQQPVIGHLSGKFRPL